MMNSHPSFPVLSPYFEKYPGVAGSLFQAYNDIVFAQKWQQVQVVDLPVCSRAAITGYNPSLASLLHVIPCSISEAISMAWLNHALDALSNPSEIYLAIVSDDASVVYYKISSGFVKPGM